MMQKIFIFVTVGNFGESHGPKAVSASLLTVTKFQE